VDVPATKTRGRRGATWNEDQLVLVTRHGRREDVWWTYSFGPIDFEGNVGGVPRRDAKFVVSALTPTRRSRHADADVVGHDETLAGRLFVRRLAPKRKDWGAVPSSDAGGKGPLRSGTWSGPGALRRLVMNRTPPCPEPGFRMYCSCLP